MSGNAHAATATGAALAPAAAHLSRRTKRLIGLRKGYSAQNFLHS
jgi:hypothetical protein